MEEESMLVRQTPLMFGIVKLGKGDIKMFSRKI
jgi:hypothetical protein